MNFSEAIAIAACLVSLVATWITIRAVRGEQARHSFNSILYSDVRAVMYSALDESRKLRKILVDRQQEKSE